MRETVIVQSEVAPSGLRGTSGKHIPCKKKTIERDPTIQGMSDELESKGFEHGERVNRKGDLYPMW